MVSSIVFTFAYKVLRYLKNVLKNDFDGIRYDLIFKVKRDDGVFTNPKNNNKLKHEINTNDARLNAIFKKKL